jgi:hypothetical protein
MQLQGTIHHSCTFAKLGPRTLPARAGDALRSALVLDHGIKPAVENAARRITGMYGAGTGCVPRSAPVGRGISVASWVGPDANRKLVHQRIKTATRIAQQEDAADGVALTR